MTLLNDKHIKLLANPASFEGWFFGVPMLGGDTEPMISPFVATKTRTLEDGREVPSYGLSSFGYDIRLGDKFKPEHPSLAATTLNANGDLILQGGQSVLAVSQEYFHMPPNVMAVCVGKSSWARKFLFVNVTPLEPNWRGYLTLELTNMGKMPIVIPIGCGIAQLLFHAGEPPESGYGDGKYQDQPNEPVESK